MIRPLSDLIEWKYRHILKPLLFLIPPDEIHERGLFVGKWSAQIPGVAPIMKAVVRYDDPILEQNLLEAHFMNPVGLAAGYDYKAFMPAISSSLGLGWQSVGSVTAGAYGGNKPPMYGRLPQTQSLWVNKGFKNEGVQVLTQRLIDTASHPDLPVGVSIGATNQAYATLDEVLQEYQTAFQVIERYQAATYYELNISCPNLQSKYSLYEPENLRQLLEVTDALKLNKPVLIKMPVDISHRQLFRLLDLISEHEIAGIIIGNLTKKKSTRAIWRSEAERFPDFGGYSGKAVQALSDDLIFQAARYTGGELLIVGTGGVFTGADAYRKIRAGASLVQLITGLIYRGPQAVGQINHELATLLRRDGFTSISEAIGADSVQ